MARNLTNSASDYIDCGNLTAMNNLTGFVLSAWINPKNQEFYVSRHNGSNHGFAMQYFHDSGVIPIGFYLNVTNNGTGNTGTWLITLTKWTHCTMFFDGTIGTASQRVKLYLDGVLQTPNTTQSWPSSLPSITEEFLIGGLNGAGRTWNQMDYAKIKFWGVALAVGEIKNDSVGKVPRQESLIVNLPLDGYSPEPDYSGNGNNGTINGTIPVVDGPPVAELFGYDESQMFAVGAAPPAATPAWARYGTYLKRRLLILSGLFRMAFAKLIPHAPHP